MSEWRGVGRCRAPSASVPIPTKEKGMVMVPDSDFDRHTSLKDKLSRIFDGHVVVNTFTVRAKNSQSRRGLESTTLV